MSPGAQGRRFALLSRVWASNKQLVIDSRASASALVISDEKIEHTAFTMMEQIFRVPDCNWTPRQIVQSLWVSFLAVFTLLSVFTSIFYVPTTQRAAKVRSDIEQQHNEHAKAVSAHAALLARIHAPLEPRVALLMSFPNSVSSMMMFTLRSLFHRKLLIIFYRAQPIQSPTRSI